MAHWDISEYLPEPTGIEKKLADASEDAGSKGKAKGEKSGPKAGNAAAKKHKNEEIMGEKYFCRRQSSKEECKCLQYLSTASGRLNTYFGAVCPCSII